ncbi:hypothetical protein [Sporomusa sp.]|uniref:hypothetical protein n=1 Tax=Sporomusa sp. TaxID=2078658 RepID=UPI002BCD0780|nr:hypothetical protein [Sporomusa sp.]HWR07086.1 hypothetical protein [Sporomusa sp.]
MSETKGREAWGYIVLDRLLTDDMVNLMLQMEVRVPVYINALAEKAEKTVEEAAKLVDLLVHIGALEYHTDDDGVDWVMLNIFATGMFRQDWRGCRGVGELAA